MIPYVFLFFFGSCIGSFLNVCIDRWPKGQSVFHPRSHCAHCGKPIPFYLNIPILTWFMLKGKTACCRKSIHIRSVLSEIFVGIFAVATYAWAEELFLPYFLFFCLLWVAFFTDLETFLLPDEITLVGMICGLICSLFYPQLHTSGNTWDSFQKSLQGMAWGSGGLFLFASFSEWILKKEAMGLGDVKLLGCVGAFCGAKACLYTLFLGSFLGTGCFIWQYMRAKFCKNVKPLSLQQVIPFGPFLSIGAVMCAIALRECPSFFSLFSFE